jgi:short-subunit dehydrogenase
MLLATMALPPPQSGSTAVITGASSGIGEEFARQLAARGHGVFLVARREERLRALADDLERLHGIRAEVATANLEDAAEVEALPGLVAERGLDVEILVNNAGFTTVGDVHANPDRQVGMIRVNCEALVALTSAWLPGMVERGRGAVIQVASVASFQPIPVQAVYAATKAFVRSFSEAVSSELKGTGVSMTALCPGPVATEFLEAGGFKKDSPGPSFVWSTAEDVAKAGIEGVDKGKRVVIPGVGNRAQAFFGRHGPQSIVLGPVATAYRRVIGE